MLLVIALAFAVVNGINDGAAMLAASLKAPGLRPIVAIAVMSLVLAVAPVLVGTRVASTLLSGLVDAGSQMLPAVLAVAVVAAVLVVFVLTRLGLPTSLTLAVVGGIVGAALGGGLPVTWSGVALVLAVGLAAPLIGGLIGFAVARSPLGLPGYRRGRRGLEAAHMASFGLQSIAYAANDGQKMFAVLAVAAAGAGAQISLPGWQLAAVASLFALGTVAGVSRATRMLGGGVLRGRPRDEVTAEFSSAVAVLGSAALGAPVSMTQAVSGALVGSGMHRGSRRIRWRVALRLAAAWVLTLPSAGAVAAILGAAVGVRT